MTEENGIDEETLHLPEQIPYASEEDLPKQVKFATTRKAGYVEEEVDKWMNETIHGVSGFLGKYNELAYQYMMLFSLRKKEQAEVEDRINKAIEEAKASNSGVSAISAPADVDLGALREEITAEIDRQYQTGIADLHAQYAEREQQITEHYESQLAANPAPVAPVAETPASHNARVFTEAAEQARMHVEQTEARMSVIEAEAREEADRQIAESIQRGTAILEEAKAEALKYVDEANVAIEQKNNAIEQRNEIFERLRLLYASQIESINEEEASLGYSPVLTEDTVVEFDPVSAHEEVEDVTSYLEGEHVEEVEDQDTPEEEPSLDDVPLEESAEVEETVESEDEDSLEDTVSDSETEETEETEVSADETPVVEEETPDYDALLGDALREDAADVQVGEVRDTEVEDISFVTPDENLDVDSSESTGDDDDYYGYGSPRKPSDEGTL